MAVPAAAQARDLQKKGTQQVGRTNVWRTSKLRPALFCERELDWGMELHHHVRHNTQLAHLFPFLPPFSSSSPASFLFESLRGWRHIFRGKKKTILGEKREKWEMRGARGAPLTDGVPLRLRLMAKPLKHRTC